MKRRWWILILPGLLAKFFFSFDLERFLRWKRADPLK
jgi:hypothetical protein